MSHPTGKTLIQGDDGQLYIVSRETDRDEGTAFALLRVQTELVDAFRHKYEAVRAVARDVW